MQKDVSIKIILYLCQSSPAGASLQPLRWCELVARTCDYGACSSHKELKALLNSRHKLQARPTAL